MRRKMKAGAGCEDLRVRCPHYYSVATRLHAAMQVRGQPGADADAGTAPVPPPRGPGLAPGMATGLSRAWGKDRSCARHGSWVEQGVGHRAEATGCDVWFGMAAPVAMPTPLVRRPLQVPLPCVRVQACVTADEDFPAFILDTFRSRYKVRYTYCDVRGIRQYCAGCKSRASGAVRSSCCAQASVRRAWRAEGAAARQPHAPCPGEWDGLGQLRRVHVCEVLASPRLLPALHRSC
jgi:hypothetical protein